MEPDHVDDVLAQWKRERPGVDVSAMAIIGRLSRLDKAIDRQLDDVFAEHGLELWEFDVLATLLRTGSPHQLTPGELLDAMMITSGAMTNRLDRLEKRGFVERAKSPADGHKYSSLSPTPASQQSTPRSSSTPPTSFASWEPSTRPSASNSSSCYGSCSKTSVSSTLRGAKQASAGPGHKTSNLDSAAHTSCRAESPAPRRLWTPSSRGK